MLSVDLNCDMGESTNLHTYNIEKDLDLLRYASSINLACGFHAGDASTMHHLVTSALKSRIAIGAHPSFPDRQHFGRTDMPLTPDEVYDIVLYQLGALQAFLKVHHHRLHHVKPHGALYNKAATNRPVADAIVHAIRDYDRELMLYGLSGSELIAAARLAGLQTASEVFADRTYLEDGTLTPRASPDALIESSSGVLRQVLQMVREGTVCTTNGKTIHIDAQTICLHGDGRNASELAKAIRQTLHENGIEVRHP